MEWKGDGGLEGKGGGVEWKLRTYSVVRVCPCVVSRSLMPIRTCPQPVETLVDRPQRNPKNFTVGPAPISPQ